MIGQPRDWGVESPFMLCGYCHRAVAHRCKSQAAPILSPALDLLGMKRGASWDRVPGCLL